MTYYKLKHRTIGSLCYAIQIKGDNDSELKQFMEHFFGKEFLTSIDADYKLNKKYQKVGEWILASPMLIENTYKYSWCSEEGKNRVYEQIDEIEHIKIDGAKLANDIYLNMINDYQKMKCELKGNTKQDPANALSELTENVINQILEIVSEKDDEETAELNKAKKSKRKKDSLFFYKLKHRDNSYVYYGIQKTGENQQELEEFLDAFLNGLDEEKKEFLTGNKYDYNNNVCLDWLIVRDNNDGTFVFEYPVLKDKDFKERYKIIEEIEFGGDSKKKKFKRELSALINQYNYDTKADTFDFVLADYLYNCLKNYIKSNKKNNELLLNEEL